MTLYFIFFTVFFASSLISFAGAVTCRPDGICYELCIETDDEFTSCNNRVIDFSTATNGAYMECFSEQTCINVTLICPMNASVAPNCEIRGHHRIFQSHSNWTIYAENSWTDLIVDNFNVFIQGIMYCGVVAADLDELNQTNESIASCAIQYGLWNCMDAENECFRKQSDEEEFIFCGDDADGLSCQQQEVVNCINATDAGVCNIVCDGNASCASTLIDCGTVAECNVLCVGSNACRNATIQCPTQDVAAGVVAGNCSVVCGSPQSTESCANAVIDAADSRSDLNVYAMGVSSLYEAQIMAPSFFNAYIQCNEEHACTSTMFVANESDMFDIGCNYDASDACENIRLYCPINGQNCFISGFASDVHNDLQIYARGGWNDVMIDDEYKQNAEIATDGMSMMHCADNADYDGECVIGADWFCVCPSSLLTTTTAMNGTLSTLETTESGHSDDDDGLTRSRELGYIVGGVFMGCVCMSICACFCYWQWGIKRIDKKKNTDSEKYQRVQSDDVDQATEKNISHDPTNLEMGAHTSLVESDDEEEKEEIQANITDK